MIAGLGLRSQRRQVRLLPGAPLGVEFAIAFVEQGGPLAQLAEQLTLNQRVRGSSPRRPTNCDGHFGYGRVPVAALTVRVLSVFSPCGLFRKETTFRAVGC